MIPHENFTTNERAPLASPSSPTPATKNDKMQSGQQTANTDNNAKANSIPGTRKKKAKGITATAASKSNLSLSTHNNHVRGKNSPAASPHSLLTSPSSMMHDDQPPRRRTETRSSTLNYVMQPTMCAYTQPTAEEDLNRATTYAVSGGQTNPEAGIDDLPLGADASSITGDKNAAPKITIITTTSAMRSGTRPHTSLGKNESADISLTRSRSSHHHHAPQAAAAKYMAKEGWRSILPANISNAIAFERKHSEIEPYDAAEVPLTVKHSTSTDASGPVVRVRSRASTATRSMIASYMQEAPGDLPPDAVSQMMKTVIQAASTNPLPTLQPWRENLVLLACFCAMIMIEPIAVSSGVFLTPLVRDLNVTYGEVSFALGLQSGGVYLIAPLTNFLNEHFGFQLCAIISVIVSILGFAGTAYFATTIWHFYIGYGFVSGISLGVTLMSIFGGLGFMFPGKDGKVTFAITGVAVGNMVMPPLLDAIINQWHIPDLEGWRAGLYIISFLQVFLLFLCMIIRVPGERCCRGPSQLSSTESKRALIPRSIRNKRWLFLSIAYFFWNMHRLFQMFAPHIISIHYHGVYNSGIVITVFGVSELIGRVLTVVLNSRPIVRHSWRYALMSACLLIKSACLCCAALLLEFVDDIQFEVLCIPIAAAGFLAGIVWNTFPWYILGEFGPFHFAQASDWMEVFAGVAALVSVVSAGQITQLSNTAIAGTDNIDDPMKKLYLVAPFYMASAGVCGAWLSFLVFIVMSKRHLRKSQQEKPLQQQHSAIKTTTTNAKVEKKPKHVKIADSAKVTPAPSAATLTPDPVETRSRWNKKKILKPDSTSVENEKKNAATAKEKQSHTKIAPPPPTLKIIAPTEQEPQKSSTKPTAVAASVTADKQQQQQENAGKLHPDDAKKVPPIIVVSSHLKPPKNAQPKPRVQSAPSESIADPSVPKGDSKKRRSMSNKREQVADANAAEANVVSAEPDRHQKPPAALKITTPAGHSSPTVSDKETKDRTQISRSKTPSPARQAAGSPARQPIRTESKVRSKPAYVPPAKPPVTTNANHSDNAAAGQEIDSDKPSVIIPFSHAKTRTKLRSLTDEQVQQLRSRPVNSAQNARAPIYRAKHASGPSANIRTPSASPQHRPRSPAAMPSVEHKDSVDRIEQAVEQWDEARRTNVPKTHHEHLPPAGRRKR